MGARGGVPCAVTSAAGVLAVWLAVGQPLEALAGSADFPHKAKELDKVSFQTYLNEEKAKGRPCLIMFHVDWCKVCQRVFPKFANASNMVYSEGHPVNFAHVDCTNDKTLCLKFEVKGYPTIKFFQPKRDAEPLTFTLPRTEPSFFKYAERMTQPVVRQYAGRAEFVEAVKKEALAAFVIAGEPGKLPQEVTAVAEKWMDRHLFVAAPGGVADLLPPEAASAPGAAGCPTGGCKMAVLSMSAQQWEGGKGDGLPEPPAAVAFFGGELGNATELEEWLTSNRFPGVWALDDTNFHAFTHSARRAAMIVLDPSNVPKSQVQLVREVAERLKHEFTFGIVDGVAWSDELSDFNIAKKDLPRVLVTEDELSTWVEDIEQLRFEHLERDLRALAEGAPLLRQSRSGWSQAKFFFRESQRSAIQLAAFASRGPKQATLVAVGVLVALGLLLASFWCVYTTCKVLLLDDFDAEPPPGSHQAKRD